MMSDEDGGWRMDDDDDDDDDDDEVEALFVVDNDDFEVLRLLKKDYIDTNSNTMKSPTF